MASWHSDERPFARERRLILICTALIAAELALIVWAWRQFAG